MRRGDVAPATLALLACIRRHQPVAAFALFSVFEGAGEHINQFRHKLTSLRADGWLVNSGSTHEGVWSLTNKATALLDRPAAPLTAAATKDGWTPGPVVPPRQIDVLHAPPYQPAPEAYRAGAFDHQAHPSLISSHSVPFWAGVQGEGA